MKHTISKLIMTKRQRNVLAQLPLTPPWQHVGYFWKNLAHPWQFFLFSFIMASLNTAVMILFAALIYGSFVMAFAIDK